MRDIVLVVNTGSSSLKCAFHPAEGPGAPVVVGEIDGIGGPRPRMIVRRHGRERVETTLPPGVGAAGPVALESLVSAMRDYAGEVRVAAVGHRVVHGGATRAAPARIDDALLAELDALVPLAPLHQPQSLATIRLVRRAFPGLPQVACFDTAFHRTRPLVAELYGLPWDCYERGIRRYGFHGLSYESIADDLRTRAPDIATGRVVVAHLGSGASAAALAGGRSVDSTMGFTALDGLPMGTRPGQLDPGVVLHFIKQEGRSAEEVEDLLYRRSGLLGLSGESNDMRDLLASDHPRAALAVDYFVARVAREIAALVPSLGGLDALVFTAGIGERSPPIRAGVAARLAWLGIELDDGANATNAESIGARASRVPVLVLPSDEGRVIARHTRELAFAPMAAEEVPT